MFLVAEFLLEGIPANQAGAEEIEVAYRYNLNGILEVTAKCVSTGKAMSVTVQDALNRDSQEAFAESASRLAALFNDTKQDESDFDPDINDDEWELLDSLLGEDDDESKSGFLALRARLLFDSEYPEEAIQTLDDARVLYPDKLCRFLPIIRGRLS